MIWALNGLGDRVLAYPAGKATCPSCGGQVIAKCGNIIAWHWAHQSADCDPWAEGESDWHIGWKERFPSEWQEVVCGPHRADVKTPLCVVEFQRSAISSDDIAAREEHYGRMVWVVDGSGFHNNFSVRNRGAFQSFRWKWPRKTWWHARRDVYFDFNGSLFQIGKLHPNIPCGGWGRWVSIEQFMYRTTASTGSRIASGCAVGGN